MISGAETLGLVARNRFLVHSLELRFVMQMPGYSIDIYRIIVDFSECGSNFSRISRRSEYTRAPNSNKLASDLTVVRGKGAE